MLSGLISGVKRMDGAGASDLLYPVATPPHEPIETGASPPVWVRCRRNHPATAKENTVIEGPIGLLMADKHKIHEGARRGPPKRRGWKTPTAKPVGSEGTSPQETTRKPHEEEADPRRMCSLHAKERRLPYGKCHVLPTSPVLGVRRCLGRRFPVSPGRCSARRRSLWPLRAQLSALGTFPAGVPLLLLVPQLPRRLAPVLAKTSHVPPRPRTWGGVNSSTL